MDTLIDEMLLEIFEWLPPKTRRISRLVCRRWNQICLSHIFTKEEKVVFYDGYSLDLVAPLFEFNRRQTLNLQFICTAFHWTDNEISFWKSYGDRVESIHLNDGDFDFTDLKRVIEFCPNLETIKLQCFRALSEWLNHFDVLVKMNFIAPSVTTFHFEFHNDDHHPRRLLTDYKLSKILAMFPNLTIIELDFDRHHLCYGSYGSQTVASDSVLSISGIVHMLCDIAKNLKKLHLKVCGSSGSDISTLLSKLENVEELTFIPSFSRLVRNVGQPNVPSLKQTFAPLLKLTELTSLTLCTGSLIFYSVAELIPVLLRELTHLRDLQMDTINILELNEDLIQSLVFSALKTLSISFRQLVPGAFVHLYNSKNINRKLEKISILYRGSGNLPPTINRPAYVDLFSILSQYFQNVNDLTVSYPNDEILQHIFKYQERLRKLRLLSCASCTDFGFTGLSDSMAIGGEQVTYCISELSNLEFLRIDPANNITEKTFFCFVFPKLKTLELVKFGHSQSEMSLNLFRCRMPYLTKFEFLMEYSQSLEVLKLDFSSFVPQEELEEILRPFKQLRYIKISEQNHLPTHLRKNTDDKWPYNYGIFFEMCPYLRKFAHNDKWCYVNILTKGLAIPKFPKIKQLSNPSLD